MPDLMNRIVEPLRQLSHPIAELVIDPLNARKHGDRNIQEIMKSLSYYEQRTPVVANSKTMIIQKGNGLVMAAKELGWTEVAVVWVDDDEETAKAYGIMDNQSGLLSEWDMPRLKDLLEELDTGSFDTGLTGFTTEEIEGLMSQVHLDGDVTSGRADKTLAERFIIPPFSLLDTRQGYWQERKRAWIQLGIQSELGRGMVNADAIPDNGQQMLDKAGQYDRRKKPNVPSSEKALRRKADQHSNITSTAKMPAWSNIGMENIAAGTSIFDPVLTELAYRWFCPSGGVILDPFAGGSVRGIVAGRLGYHYIGIDLSGKQLEANREQWERLAKGLSAPQNEETDVRVKISSKWAGHLFNCTTEHIKDKCHGRCCQGTGNLLISLLPDEQEWQKAQGHTVEDGKLMPAPMQEVCPHKSPEGLCQLHDTENKPFGCIVSPFKLNDNNTLILRDRYIKMECHGSGMPAYQVFRSSFNILFGSTQTDRLAKELATGVSDPVGYIKRDVFDHLNYLEGIKRELSRALRWGP